MNFVKVDKWSSQYVYILCFPSSIIITVDEHPLEQRYWATAKGSISRPNATNNEKSLCYWLFRVIGWWSVCIWGLLLTTDSSKNVSRKSGSPFELVKLRQPCCECWQTRQNSPKFAKIRQNSPKYNWQVSSKVHSCHRSGVKESGMQSGVMKLHVDVLKRKECSLSVYNRVERVKFFLKTNRLSLRESKNVSITSMCLHIAMCTLLPHGGFERES